MNVLQLMSRSRRKLLRPYSLLNTPRTSTPKKIGSREHDDLDNNTESVVFAESMEKQMDDGDFDGSYKFVSREESPQIDEEDISLNNMDRLLSLLEVIIPQQWTLYGCMPHLLKMISYDIMNSLLIHQPHCEENNFNNKSNIFPNGTTDNLPSMIESFTDRLVSDRDLNNNAESTPFSVKVVGMLQLISLCDLSITANLNQPKGRIYHAYFNILSTSNLNKSYLKTCEDMLLVVRAIFAGIADVRRRESWKSASIMGCSTSAPAACDKQRKYPRRHSSKPINYASMMHDSGSEGDETNDISNDIYDDGKSFQNARGNMNGNHHGALGVSKKNQILYDDNDGNHTRTAENDVESNIDDVQQTNFTYTLPSLLRNFFTSLRSLKSVKNTSSTSKKTTEGLEEYSMISSSIGYWDVAANALEIEGRLQGYTCQDIAQDASGKILHLIREKLILLEMNILKFVASHYESGKLMYK